MSGGLLMDIFKTDSTGLKRILQPVDYTDCHKLSQLVNGVKDAWVLIAEDGVQRQFGDRFSVCV